MKCTSVFFILSCLFAFGGCKKETDTNNEAFCSHGFIYWGGDVEADGEGWYFCEKRDGNWKANHLKAQDIPNGFKKTVFDSTGVFVCLEKTIEKMPPCECLPGQSRYYYYIKSITKY